MYRIAQIKSLLEYEVIKPTWINEYKDDPSVNFFGEATSELKSLTAEVCISAGIVGGQFFAAFDKNNQVVGTALWYPPGKDALVDEMQLLAASKALKEMEEYNPQAHNWFMFTFVTAMQNPPEEYGRANHWKLYSFTVADEHEGTGLDELLLKTGEDQAAAQGLAICYEEMRGNEIERFKRLGYQVVTKGQVPGPQKDGFELYYLRKFPGA